MRLSAGLSLKPAHLAAAQESDADGLWFEVHPENYMVDGGPRAAGLDRLRARYPLSLHGVGLSLGSCDTPDAAHLRRLQQLCERLEPALVSEHLAWSRWNGHCMPDLLPLPRTFEALACVCRNVSIVQDALGRAIAIENPSHYLRIAEHEIGETAFLTELCARTGCGLLVDINNVHVSAQNLGFDAGEWLDGIPAATVHEIHLAGHSADPVLGPSLLIDSHDTPVSAGVWALYQRFITRIGPHPTLIERDDRLPAFEVLMQERGTAAALLAAAAPARERQRA